MADSPESGFATKSELAITRVRGLILAGELAPVEALRRLKQEAPRSQRRGTPMPISLTCAPRSTGPG